MRFHDHSNPYAIALQWRSRDWKGRRVDFLFECGWCGTECVLWGEPVASWWTQKYWLPDDGGPGRKSGHGSAA